MQWQALELDASFWLWFGVWYLLLLTIYQTFAVYTIQYAQQRKHMSEIQVSFLGQGRYIPGYQNRTLPTLS